MIAENGIPRVPADRSLGVEKAFLHNLNRDRARFVEEFGERVLPGLE